MQVKELKTRHLNATLVPKVFFQLSLWIDVEASELETIFFFASRLLFAASYRRRRLNSLVFLLGDSKKERSFVSP